MHAAWLILFLFGCRQTPASPDSLVLPAAACGFDQPTHEGKLRDHQLLEVSGLAVARDLRWVHNDSGGYARLFGLDAAGHTKTILTLTGVDAVDWEDIAVLPGGDGLIAGDIGDNRAVRESVLIHRVTLPTPLETGKVDAETFTLTYPEGPQNAESMFVDPKDGVLWILTKSDGGKSRLYSALLPPEPGAVVMDLQSEVAFPEESRGTDLTTAMAIRADGGLIAVRTYTDAWIWTRGEDMSIPRAMEAEPCRMQLVAMPQGEALGFDAGDLVTVSEGAGQPLWRYAASSSQ